MWVRRLDANLVAQGLGSCVRQVGTRGIPYSPHGTIHDFTSSPRHLALAEMQFDLDRRMGRTSNGLYDASTYVPGVGAQPAKHLPFHGTRGNSQYDECPLQPKTLEELLPKLRSGYTEDLRVDREHSDLPEHVRAAKQSILMAQSDSCGEVLRGLVPPPPDVDCSRLNVYQPPRVHLPFFWWWLVGIFTFMFIIMGKYGA